jgi:hypothetical protein
MSPMLIKDPVTPAPRFLPALVIIAALIVMAGLVSLHAGAIEPARADLSHIG